MTVGTTPGGSTPGPQFAAKPGPTNLDLILIAALSGTAGAADVIGFLGLGGLLVAHITGNLVLLAAHYLTGSYGQIGTILSVPMFVLVLALVTGTFSGKDRRTTLRILLILHFLLLTASLAIAAIFGPFTNPDAAIAVCCGMVAVAAMATQSARVKLDLPGFTSTVVLTTNPVQLTIGLDGAAFSLLNCTRANAIRAIEPWRIALKAAPNDETQRISSH